MTRKLCKAARLIVLELAADIATESWQRTKTWRSRIRMIEARTKALRAG